jgi:hypothetical protein
VRITENLGKTGGCALEEMLTDLWAIRVERYKEVGERANRQHSVSRRAKGGCKSQLQLCQAWHLLLLMCELQILDGHCLTRSQLGLGGPPGGRIPTKGCGNYIQVIMDGIFGALPQRQALC